MHRGCTIFSPCDDVNERVLKQIRDNVSTATVCGEVQHGAAVLALDNVSTATVCGIVRHVATVLLACVYIHTRDLQQAFDDGKVAFQRCRVLRKRTILHDESCVQE
jgi:hypothetical protein